MATTIVARNDPMAVKLWERGIGEEFLKAFPLTPLIGTSQNDIIQLKDIASKMAGDRISFAIKYQLMGDGVSEGMTLEGNEEALQRGSESLAINELAHAVRIKNEDTIDQQRIQYDLRVEARSSIIDWYTTRMTTAFFLQACGYTGKNITVIGRNKDHLDGRHYGYNPVLAPSPNRWLIAGGKSSEAELTTGDEFNLQYIDHMVEWAQLANPMIRPIKVDGDDCYVLYLHPSQVTALRTNTDTGQWLDIAKYADQGKGDNTRIYKGSLGRYNNVILRKSEFVTTGVDGNGNAIPNVRRAVLLGAQALVIGFGRDKGPNRFRVREEDFDYGRELGVAVKTLYGLKKTRFSFNGQDGEGEDYGVIVLSTFAPRASGIITKPGGGNSGITTISGTAPIVATVNGNSATISLADSGVTEGKIAAGAVTGAKIANSTIGVDKLSATGTKDGTTRLAGDNTFKAAATQAEPASSGKSK